MGIALRRLDGQEIRGDKHFTTPEIAQIRAGPICTVSAAGSASALYLQSLVYNGLCKGRSYGRQTCVRGRIGLRVIRCLLQGFRTIVNVSDSMSVAYEAAVVHQAAKTMSLNGRSTAVSLTEQ